jgi:hypothetical protein
MLPRVVAGVVLCLVGALWIAQGVGVAQGSPMTDHAIWAYLGAAVIVGGLGLVAAGARR